SRIINNMMAILISPDALGTGEDFARDMDRYTDWVKGSPQAPGVEAVEFPGDPERRCARDRQAHGIPVDPGTWAQLLETARTVGVPQDRISSLPDK
ncbi:MAG: Ldh family oxidoreductase, partial [Rhodobacterales bacterium]|nr:Ldh family oxidoreductase [Rhodobacterales bacterium]